MVHIHAEPESLPGASPIRRAFPLPPTDGMQDEVRLAFLHEQVLRWGDPKLGKALEIGVYKACSTIVLADACRQRGFANVTAVDLFTGSEGWHQTEDTEAAARERLCSYGLDHTVQLVRGDSRTFDWQAAIAVLHIDGDHQYEGVRSDIHRFAPLIVAGGIIVFDDYDQAHPGVQRAVHELLAAPAGFTVVGANNHRVDTGSLCVRRGS